MPSIIKKEFHIPLIILAGLSLGYGLIYNKLLFTFLLLSPIFIYLAIVHPFIFPFGLYLALLPFDEVLSMSSYSQGPTLTRLLGFLTICIFFFKGAFEKKFVWPGKVSISWFLFLSYGAISAVWAIKSSSTISVLPTAVGMVALYAAVSCYSIQKKEFDTLKWFIVAGGMFCGLHLIYQYTSGLDYGMQGRMILEVEGRFSTANKLAFALIIPFAVSIQMIQEQKKNILKGFLVFAFGIITFAIILTGSRGGFLGIVTIVTVYLLSHKKRTKLSIIFIIIGSFIVMFAPDFFVERWSDPGGSGRTTIWYIGWQAVSKYWATGAGLNNFPNAFNEFAHHVTHYTRSSRGAHNIYLQIIIELGVIGFSLFIAALAIHYRTIPSKKYNADSTMLKSSFWGILVSSFFLGSLWMKSFWLVPILIMLNKNSLRNNARNITQVTH